MNMTKSKEPIAWRRVLRQSFYGGIFAACAVSLAAAQGNYPERPIRWILPIAAGGGSDTLARTIQAGFTESIGQQIVIDNRPGGSSVIGTEITAKAAPDGYTLLFITTTHPEVPTTSEAGVQGLESGTWYGILVPARTPQSIVDRLYAATAKTMQLPDVKARLLAQGVDIISSSPQQFSAYLKSETAKWAKVIKDANVRPE